MEPCDSNADLLAICRQTAVVPVLTIEDPACAKPLAKALARGGLTTLEITLRTSAALECIREVAELSGILVGAGSLISAEHVSEAKAAGARFGVSPGATDELIRASTALQFPLLPGAATPTEIMRLIGAGFSFLKFFPAEAAGGINALKSFAGPLRQAVFCPTGGIGKDNAGAYLKLENVVCVGGSWIAPSAQVNNGEWDVIEEHARDAAQSFSGSRL